MKRVRDIINLREEEPSGPASFTDASGDTGPYADNQDGEITGGGRVQNYPVSAANVRWIREQGGAFSFGFLGGHTLENLTLELLGTDLSAELIKSSKTEYDALFAQQGVEQDAWSDYFTNVWTPAYNAMKAQVAALESVGDYQGALNVLNAWNFGPQETELARLERVYQATNQQHVSLLSRMSDYIMSGKINDPDPFELDHPEIAYQKKKREELEKNIETSLEQLAKDNEELKSEGAKRNILAIVDLGFDIATAIAILNVFAGPADELSLQAIKQGVRKFFTKGATKTATKTGFGKGIKQTVADKADDVLTDLAVNRSKYGNVADDIAKQLDDAMYSGDTQQVQKILQQADDLVTGRGTTWTSKTGGSTATKPKPTTTKPKSTTTKPKPKSDKWKSEPLGDGSGVGSRGNYDQFGRKINPATGKPLSNSHKPEGKVLSETKNRKRIFRDLKKPVEVPELPKKYKMNFAGKYSSQNTPDKTSSQISDALVASGNAKGQRWKQKDKEWQGYETTERMNVVYDKVGHGDHYWNKLVDGNSRKKKDRELQEKLNIIAHEKALVQENPNYKTPFNQSLDEQETLSVDNDPLFKKVSKHMKKEIDYPDKPSKNGYPNDPPPEMVNGYHPDLVVGKKVSNYYNRLGPSSAKAMPPTGNPHIDKKVRAAAKKPK